jgi:hypothetical protein
MIHFARLSKDMESKKKGLLTSKSQKSLSAVRGGFEPLLTKPVSGVFKLSTDPKVCIFDHFNTFQYSLSVLYRAN